MRVAFIVPGFSPSSSSGLDQHTLALTQALVRLGVSAEVLATRNSAGLAPMAQRREVVDGVGVTWVNGGAAAVERDWALATGAFLERETPDLVHLESMQGAGTWILAEIEKRGIPVIHNAWDVGRVAMNEKALAADLMPFDVANQDAHARDQMAQKLLAGHPELGQHGGHILPAQVDDAFWEKLQGYLSGGETPALEGSRKRVDDYRSAALKAYGSMSGRYAASRWLSRTLAQVSSERVEYVAPGVEISQFQSLIAPHAGRGKIRFGFLGDMDKASGAHLLIDAFCGLADKAELRLFGTCSDRRHMRTLRANAERVEARWYGAVDSEDRMHAMERMDVLVVPSMWQASAPHEIREAFAARRPVIVCDLEAPSEMVIDGQNGLLFAAGDCDSLRAAMQRFIDQPTLLDELELGVKPQRDISEEARQWADIYAVQVQLHGRKPSAVPANMVAFAERYEALKGLPTRELFQKVARGLTNLSARMGVDLDPLTAVSQAVAQGGRGRDERMGSERIRNWLETSVQELEETRKMLMAQDAEMRVERGVAAQKTRELEACLEKERVDMRTIQVAWDSAKEQRDAAQAEIETLRAELGKQSERLCEIEDQETQLRGEMGRLGSRVLATAEIPGSDAEPLPNGDVRILIERLHSTLDQREQEMTWRRREMDKARMAGKALIPRMFARGLVAQVSQWDVIPGPQATPDKGPIASDLASKEIHAVRPLGAGLPGPAEMPKSETKSTEMEAKQ